MSPDEEMYNARKAAPSIMNFISKNDLPDGMKARTALAAWYFAEHTKATSDDKLMSIEILKMSGAYKQRHDSQKASSKP